MNPRRPVERGLDDVKMGVSHCTPRKVQEKPCNCLHGIRQRGGMTLIQAQPWNVGTCRSDVKQEAQVVKSHKRESSDAEHRDGVTRSSAEASVMEVERRGWHARNIQCYQPPTHDWQG